MLCNTHLIRQELLPLVLMQQVHRQELLANESKVVQITLRL